MRRIGLPQSLWQKIESLLQTLGHSYSAPVRLAKDITRLSDFYITHPKAATPWNERWAQAAYLAYYLPLNYARARAVMLEAERLGFFSGLKSFVDFGSGLGSAQLALAPIAPFVDQGLCVDLASVAMDFHRELYQNLSRQQGLSEQSIHWSPELVASRLAPARSRLAIFSYVHTELEGLPAWAEASEAILLIEPSTRDDGRRLLELRKRLLAEGFTAVGPCTHQKPCPLLESSQRDWCHHRILWETTPDWQRLESVLPIKNRTLTYSYLLLRRNPPASPASESAKTPETAPDLARVVGDPLREKGKSRQLICRGPEREFLSWFPARIKSEPELDRGDLIRFRTPLETKAQELRLKDTMSIEILNHSDSTDIQSLS
jgi:ribosomal protein RSM22 (predicted rRNA methylase)